MRGFVWIGLVAALGACKGDSGKRARKSEVALELNKLGKAAKVYYAERSVLPTGTATQLPAAPCCGQPSNKCATAPAATWAADPIWNALEFAQDEPGHFQYGYTGAPSGQAFTATAVGDLDCDGIAITYTLTGTVQDGNLRIDLVEPPAGAD